MWKAKVHLLEGITINVPCNGRKKIIKCKIEGVVTTRNTHNESASDFHQVYDYQIMDPDVVNPLKNFLEVFPESEMMHCIETFYLEVSSTTTASNWQVLRNKNTAYFKKLALKEFNIQKIRKFFSKCVSDPSARDIDPWWNIIGVVNQFNNIRKRTFTDVPIVVLDESMCTWRPRTTKTGGLPQLTYEQHMPESLGTEFKTTACGMTVQVKFGNYERMWKYEKTSLQ